MLPELLERIYATGTVEDAAGGAVPAFPEALPRAHAEALAGLVREHGLQSTLETGMGYGISTVAIAAASPEVRHVAIDPGQQDAFRGIGVLNAERAGVAARVTLVEERSDAALPRLAATGLALDLALIDGMHLFDYTLVDFFYADRMLRLGGVVVFHDTWMPAVRQAATFVLENRAYDRLPAGDDSMWALRKTGDDERAWDFHRNFLPRVSLRRRMRAALGR